MDAMMDSVPLVVVSGQVPTTAIGTDAFQETAITSITMGITKHNWLVTDPADLPRVVAEAFHVATSGRPGPVLVDVPKDVSNARTSWYWPSADDLDLPGYRLPRAPEPGLVRRAAELLLGAERPVLYVGGGVIKAEASEALRRLVDLSGAPVVTTLMARGAFPDDDPRCLGMPGMHGTWTATTAMQRADLLVALGSRFDDRVTGKVATFAPGAKVVHVDVDPAEIGKVRRADVGIVADCKVAIEALCEALEELGSTPEGRARPGTPAASRPDLGPWHAQLAKWRQAHPLRYEQTQGGPLKPQFVVETLRELSPPDTVVVTGVGQHQMWASQYWRFAEPRTWVTSGGAGTMGFAVPAALGAKVGRPDRTVWAIDGDGCFQMTAQELVTATAERIPVKVAILNNAYLGMVRQWQELFYEERYSEVYLSPDLPDYVQWAEAMGCRAFRVESPEEVAPTIEKANEIDDRPVVIDFRTDAFEKVYPMVPAGASNDEIIEGPAQGEGGR
jgi:acetolactate synthase-1/2/3 large subunit